MSPHVHAQQVITRVEFHQGIATCGHVIRSSVLFPLHNFMRKTILIIFKLEIPRRYSNEATVSIPGSPIAFQPDVGHTKRPFQGYRDLYVRGYRGRKMHVTAKL